MTDNQELVATAVRARNAAYAPYSGFKVGAALLMEDGSVVVGVNVENASYGLTVCAERNAVGAAVAAGCAPGQVVAVAIAAQAKTPTPPCGACRQVLAEFCRPDTELLLHNVTDGATDSLSLADILPYAFTRANMPES